MTAGSSFQLDLGLFRLVCSNGMVTPIGKAGGMRSPRPRGRQLGDRVASTTWSTRTPQLVAERVRPFQRPDPRRRRNRTSTHAPFCTALWRRLAATVPVRAAGLLGARRNVDAGDSLWLTMNRIAGEPGARWPARPLEAAVAGVPSSIPSNGRPIQPGAVGARTEEFAALRPADPLPLARALRHPPPNRAQCPGKAVF